MTARENVWLRVAKVSKQFGAVIALEAIDATYG
jgi:ABC-type sugar transport system ATPase subunit